VPMWILYELGILMGRLVKRSQEKAKAENEEQE